MSMKRSHAASGKSSGRTSGNPGSTACPSCGSTVQPNARFCHNCGKSLGDRGWFSVQTLTVLAAAGLALLALGLLFASIIDVKTVPTIAETRSVERTASSGQPPDLSTMSPREAADRLFNRVMMADEQGNAEEASRFAPMALAAYDMLETLDLDGLYHVGLISLVAGDAEGARDSIDKLKAAVANHLLAILLEYRLAEQADDRDAMDRAVAAFHAAYDDEMAAGRPEYLEHQGSIEQFRTGTMPGTG